MIYEYAGYNGPPETAAETYFSWTEDFSMALREEFVRYGGTHYSAAAGGCSFAARISDKGTGETRLLKVPQRHASAQSMGRAERATLKLLATTVPSCPLTIPELLREQDDPQRFVVTEVPGQVLTSTDKLSDTEQYLLGRDTGKLALWEGNIDTAAFASTVPLYEGWNWVKRFTDLDTFDDARYPVVAAVTQDMKRLRDIYCTPLALTTGEQVIHSDLRRPNLAFVGAKGSRRLNGAFDWGAAQVGNLAQEARGLYQIGGAALAGYNDELIENQRPPVDDQAVRFWCIGRYTLGLVYQLQAGIPCADEYLSCRDALSIEYPDHDWGELSSIDAQIYEIQHEAGPTFGLVFA